MKTPRLFPESIATTLLLLLFIIIPLSIISQQKIQKNDNMSLAGRESQLEKKTK
jgi:hypothetical protein